METPSLNQLVDCLLDRSIDVTSREDVADLLGTMRDNPFAFVALFLIASDSDEIEMMSGAGGEAMGDFAFSVDEVPRSLMSMLTSRARSEFDERRELLRKEHDLSDSDE